MSQDSPTGKKSVAKLLIGFSCMAAILTAAWRAGDWIGGIVGQLPVTSEPFPTGTPVPTARSIVGVPPPIRVALRPTSTPAPPPFLYNYEKHYEKSISPDGELIAAQINLKSIGIYRRRTVKLLRELSDPKDNTSPDTIAFSKDGKKIIVAGDIPHSPNDPPNLPDCRITIWEVATGKKLHTIIMNGRPADVTYSFDDKFYAVSASSNVTLFRSRDNNRLWMKRVPSLFITTGGGVSHGESKIAFSRDGKLLAIASGDGGISIYNTKDGQLLLNQAATLEEEVPEVCGLFFGAGGKSLFIITSRVLLWRAPWDGTVSQREKVLENADKDLAAGDSSAYKYRSVAASNDGKLVAGSTRKGIKLWRIADGTKLVDEKQPTPLFNCHALRFLPDNRTLIGTTLSQTSKRRAGTPVTWNYQKTPGVKSNIDSRLAASNPTSPGKITKSSSPLATDGASMPLVFTSTVPILPFSGIVLPATSPKEALIAGLLAGKNNAIEVNLYTKKQRKIKYNDVATTGANSPTIATPKPLTGRRAGRPVLVAASRGNIEIREVGSKTLVLTLGQFKTGLHAYVLSRDGKLACSFDPISGGKLSQPQMPYTPPGDWVTVFDIVSGKELYTLKGNGDISTIALSRDGKYLALGAMSGKIQLRNARGGQLLKTAEKYRGGVYHMDFSKDGSLLRCLVQNQYQEWKVS